MLREIKFRVWDLNENQWGNANYLECGDGGKLMYFGHTPNRDKFIIQQFTGLLDKNGVEIYEGDIISNDLFSGVIVYNKNCAAFESVFIEDYISGKEEGELLIVGYNFPAFSVSVIDNIFKNKELQLP